MDTGTGVRQWRHAAVYEETNNNVFNAPNVLSVHELVDKGKDLLTKTDGKKGVVDFIVPSISWVYLQLSPWHENRKIAERYTGKLPFKRIILSRTAIYIDHTHAHWV